ncbi:hypothetical protein [Ralstonia sp. GP101]
MRYIDAADPFAQHRIESALAPPAAPMPPRAIPPASTEQRPMAVPKPVAQTRLIVRLYIERNSKFVRGKSKARRWIEQCCLAQYQMRPLEGPRTEYEIVMPFAAGPELEQAIAELIAEMHDQADLCNCFVEVTLHDPVTDTHWS